MKSMLITGGTGTLGHALVKNLLATNAGSMYMDRIIIYSRDEMKQEAMARKFKPRDPNQRLRFFLGDVRDKDRLALAMRGVTFVVHAAALKIVPALEYNPTEAVKTNVMGSQNVMEVALSTPSVLVVLGVSTDKAVAPINLYGATKLTMEKMFIAANNYSGPKFGIIRYGNVSGSRGSVIPLFKEQLKNGKEVTITDPCSTRFWVTPEDAISLVATSLALLAYTQDYKKHALRVPRMKAYYVTALAKALGAKSFKYIGLRPGEKIHEQIYTPQEKDEYKLDHVHENSFVAPKLTVGQLKSMLKGLEEE